MVEGRYFATQLQYSTPAKSLKARFFGRNRGFHAVLARFTARPLSATLPEVGLSWLCASAKPCRKLKNLKKSVERPVTGP